MLEFLLGFSISIMAGIIGSMVGIGGGIVISPFLSYYNYMPFQISSTSLMSVFSTSLSSSIVYHKKKITSKKIGLILAISSIPGTYIGVLLSKIFSLSEFKLYFAIILISTSIYLILKLKLKYENPQKNAIFKDRNMNFCWSLLLLIISSFFAGILSSSFGIGGGIVFVPSLIIFLGFDMINAAATSQFALMFTSFSGLIFYIYYGFPEYYIGIVLSLGSICGGIVGSKISTRFHSSKLQKMFAIVLIIVSIKLLYDEFG